MATITSAGTGNWNVAATWDLVRVPANGDVVVIAAHVVTVSATETWGAANDTVTVQSGGELIINASATFTADMTIDSGGLVTQKHDLLIGDGSAGTGLTNNGTFDVPYNIANDCTLTLTGDYTGTGDWTIGTSSNRLTNSYVYTIVLNANSTTVKEGIINVSSTGALLWYGATKTKHTTLAAEATATDTSITVSDATSWRIGDSIVLVDETDDTKTEEFFIRDTYAGGDSTTVTLAEVDDETTEDAITTTKANGSFVMMMSSNIRVVNSNDTYYSYINLAGTGSNQNILSYVMLDTLGDSAAYSLEMGRDTIALNNVANLFLYKCYNLDMNENNLYSFGTINVFESQDDSIKLGNTSEVLELNSVNPTADHISGYLRIYFSLGTVRLFGGNDGVNGNQCTHVYIDNLWCNNCAADGIYFNDVNWNIGTYTANYCGIGIDLSRISNGRIGNLSMSNNVSSDIKTPTSEGICPKFVIDNADSTLNITRTKFGGEVAVTNYNNTQGLNYRFLPFITVLSDTVTYRTSSPSFKATVELSDTVPYWFDVSNMARTFYVTSGNQYDLDIYSYKDITSSGATAKLRIAMGTDTHGLSTDELDIMPRCPASVTIAFNGTTDVVTGAAHGLLNDDVVSFTTTGTMPTGLSESTDYYVTGTPNANDFQISLTQDGAAIDFTGNGSGVFTIWQRKQLDLGEATSSGFVTLELQLTKGTSTWNINLDDIDPVESTP